MSKKGSKANSQGKRETYKIPPMPLKYHGGKRYLAKRIIALMPEHITYVEPFFGGGSILLHKDPFRKAEIVSDKNGILMNFWQVLQSAEKFAKLVRLAQATPFSEITYREARRQLAYQDSMPRRMLPDHEVTLAWWFFVVARMSMAGRINSTFTPMTKTRTRRGMGGEVASWLSAIEGLPLVHERLQRVQILAGDAIEVIDKTDSKDTLVYCDPPYLHPTRSSHREYGRYEMSVKQHAELLRRLRSHSGKVLLSGYHSPLYDTMLSDWRCVEFNVANHAASGKEKRRMTECVWINTPLAIPRS